jgi:hypothetical protein
MQLPCEICHAPLRAEDVSFELSMAKCHTCNAVYDLSGRKGRGLAAVPRERPSLRPKPALPESFRMEELDGTTTVAWRWFHVGYVLLALICIAWTVLPALLYASWFEGDAPTLATVGLLLFLGTGALLAYMVLTGLVNTTRIEVSRDELRIQHGPLPWFGNVTRPGRELTQLYGQEVKGKHATTYKLLALDREGHEVLLLEHLDNKEQVLYLEQALERGLGIEDRPVDGELAQRSTLA